MVIHERAALAHRVDVVMVTKAAIRREPGGNRLVAAVHRNEVDVHVDQQVGLRCPLADLDLFALVGRAEERHRIGILGVVVVEPALGGERVVDPVTDRAPQLGLGHPSVQCECGDELDVVDTGVGRHVEHGFDDALADVGPLHLGQRQRDVVERDRQLHPRTQQRGQRLGVERVEQRVADRTVDVVHAIERLGCVDGPGAGRQLVQAQALAVVEQQRGSGAVDVEDEPGAGHQRFLSRSLRMSNAIFTPPRRPAVAACSIASR